MVKKEILTEATVFKARGPGNDFPEPWLLGRRRACTSSPLIPLAIFHNQVLECTLEIENLKKKNHDYKCKNSYQCLKSWDLTQN